MTATAKDDVVTAAADIAQSQSTGGGDFHHTKSTSKVQLTGPTTAIAEAYSHADDISLAGGVVTIGSVTSTAKGTTDGVKASATGSTLVSDMKINGIPVTVDQHGVTVNDTNNPLNKAATDAVNAAISGAGMTIAVSLPSGKPQGGSVVYNAGSVIFAWTTPGGTATAILGGATVQLAAVQGGGGLNLDLGGTPVFTPKTPAGTSGTPPLAPAGGPAPTTGEGVPGAPPAVAPAQAFAPLFAARKNPLPGPPTPAYAVLGVLGVGLLAAGMRQLPDRVLEARGTTCLLGENP
jgi:hypothetical protein